jgi:hypothetical protein
VRSGLINAVRRYAVGGVAQCCSTQSMTSIIKFTPISGAKSEDPSCYLLEVDDFCILLDCGWDDSFDVNLLGPLKEYGDECGGVVY